MIMTNYLHIHTVSYNAPIVQLVVFVASFISHDDSLNLVGNTVFSCPCSLFIKYSTIVPLHKTLNIDLYPACYKVHVKDALFFSTLMNE